MSWTFHSNTKRDDFTFAATIAAGATRSVAFNSGTFAVGDLLALQLSSGGVLSFNITDDQGNVWNEVVAGGLDRGDGYHLGLWWAIATTAGQPTVNMHNTGGSPTSFYMSQLCSWTPPNPSTEVVDTVNAVNGTGTAAISPVVTNGADELMIGFGLDTVGYPSGSHTGSTTTASFGTTFPMQYRNEAVAGTYNVGVDLGGSRPYGCIGISFSAPAPPAGTSHAVVCIMN